MLPISCLVQSKMGGGAGGLRCKSSRGTSNRTSTEPAGTRTFLNGIYRGGEGGVTHKDIFPPLCELSMSNEVKVLLHEALQA